MVMSSGAGPIAQPALELPSTLGLSLLPITGNILCCCCVKVIFTPMGPRREVTVHDYIHDKEDLAMLLQALSLLNVGAADVPSSCHTLVLLSSRGEDWSPTRHTR